MIELRIVLVWQPQKVYYDPAPVHIRGGTVPRTPYRSGIELVKVIGVYRPARLSATRYNEICGVRVLPRVNAMRVIVPPSFGHEQTFFG